MGHAPPKQPKYCHFGCKCGCFWRYIAYRHHINLSNKTFGDLPTTFMKDLGLKRSSPSHWWPEARFRSSSDDQYIDLVDKQSKQYCVKDQYQYRQQLSWMPSVTNAVAMLELARLLQQNPSNNVSLMVNIISFVLSIIKKGKNCKKLYVETTPHSRKTSLPNPVGRYFPMAICGLLSTKHLSSITIKW